MKTFTVDMTNIAFKRLKDLAELPDEDLSNEDILKEVFFVDMDGGQEDLREGVVIKEVKKLKKQKRK